MDPKAQLEFLNTIESFARRLNRPIIACKPEILQINIIRRCNLFCRHCHVEASPERTEIMSREILERALEVAGTGSLTTIDVTGGCPEMHPHLEWFLDKASHLGKRIIVRTNLVILKDKKYRKFIDVYSRNRVELCGSLPDYHEEKCDRQRGCGSFADAIEILKTLNKNGYGKEGTGLVLDLVHNPVGAYLHGSQSTLEHAYKTRLSREYGVTFNNLFCISNMPVGRYLEYLLESGNFEDYMDELSAAFNVKAADHVMCRHTVSISYNGTIFDCDFNQMLCLPANGGKNIMDVDLGTLEGRKIVLHNHCWGCTAGSGSSCQGATE